MSSSTLKKLSFPTRYSGAGTDVLTAGAVAAACRFTGISTFENNSITRVFRCYTTMGRSQRGLLDRVDRGADRGQSLLEILIAAIYRIDIVPRRFAFSSKHADEEDRLDVKYRRDQARRNPRFRHETIPNRLFMAQKNCEVGILSRKRNF